VRTGLEVYAEGIIGELLTRNEDWVLILPSGSEGWQQAGCKHECIRLRTSSSILPLFREISSLLSNKKCNIFYNPAQYAPMQAPCPVVATALDVAWRYYPDYFPRSKRIAFDLLTAHACRSAERIIAISESTRTDLIRLYRCRPDKVLVVYPGVDHGIFNTRGANDGQILEKYGLRRGNYILYLGTMQKRKNIIRLIRAHGRMKQDIPLVLAGGRGWYYWEIAEAVLQSPRRNSIRETGYIDAADRSALYRNAVCMAYVSLYEGFGFPVAEAMACGCPPVASRASSLPEIAGDVGWLADPLSEDEIAAALEKGADKGMDPGVRAAAHARAQRFTWVKSAGAVYDLLKAVSG
jgi:glycosyltransferase involved in cell wall biosynthesis